MDQKFEVGEEVLIKYSLSKKDSIGVVTNITKTGMVDIVDINNLPRRFNSNGYARGSKRTRIVKATTEELKEVKKNEKNPSTDYLFHNVNNNLNQTISKLEKMNESGETFIPRL
jgi:hypothetical protein